jgi:membrane associated rhomboid family serine protease
LKCECGKKLNPLIAQWWEELKNRPKPSAESLAEVVRESELRNRRRNKRKKVKKTKTQFVGSSMRKPSPMVKFGAFSLLVAIISGLIDLTIRFSHFFYLHYGYLTYVFTIVTCLVSLWGFRNTRIIERLKFQSSLVYEQGQYYRMVTTGLVHADGAHLFFNMISLLSIGVGTEYDFNRLFGLNGPGLFVSLYLFALIAADLPKLIWVQLLGFCPR